MTAANAGTINMASFTISQSTFANGTATSPDGGLTLILTGPNDGSGEPGYTDYLGTATTGGIFSFDWAFATSDSPGWQMAGYLVNGTYMQLASANGASGSISVSVSAGSTIGFQMQTGDNTGGAGVLTVTDFVAPAPLDTGTLATPEPGTLGLMASALILALILKLRRRRISLPGRPIHGLLLVGSLLALNQVSEAASQQTFYTGTNVTGALALTRTVNLRQQAMAVQTSSISPMAAERMLSERPPRYLPRRLRPPALSGNTGIGKEESFSRSVRPALAIAAGLNMAPNTGTGFNALSHLDQRNANGGNQFSIEPPNQSLAASTQYILEGVNDAVQVFDTSGNPLLPAVLSSNQVFGLPPSIDRTTGINGVYMTDMKVYYDSNTDRWFIIQRDQDNDIYGNNLLTSHLWLAVSLSGDPTGTYDIYVMDTTNSAHRGCPCVDDYPQVGSDQYGFYITWNEFNSYFYSFLDATVLAVSKSALTGGALSPAAYQFFLPYLTGYEFALTPSSTPPGAVNYLASGGLEYFASTLSSSAYNGGIAIWAMTNTSSLALAPNPILTMIRVPTISYLSPNVVPQRPGLLPYGSAQSPPGVLAYLDGGDNRVQSLMYASGMLYTTFASQVADQNSKSQVGAAYVVLTPTYRSGVLAANVVNQGYLVVNGNNLLRPAIAVNAAGSGAVTATLVGPDWYPSAVVIPFNSFSTPSVFQVTGLGALPEDGFTGYPGDGSTGIARWGDYNGAVVTSDGAIWTVAQYIGDFPRTELANWNTYVNRFQP